MKCLKGKESFLAALLCFVLPLASVFGTAPVGTDALAEEEDGVSETACLVVGVEFTDGSSTFDSSAKETVNEAFFGRYGLTNYVAANTNGRVAAEAGYVATVAVGKSSAYFAPAYSYTGGKWKLVNSEGYDNRCYDESGGLVPSGEGKVSVAYFAREQELIRLAADGLRAAEEIDFDAFDRNGDGDIDSICLLFGDPLTRESVSETGTGTIFWPHQSHAYYGGTEGASSLYYVGEGDEYDGVFTKTDLGGKSVRRYLAFPLDFLRSDAADGIYSGSTVLCHEFMHVLGMPDYYSYDGSDTEYVGELDIMDKNATPPQLSLSYTRQKQGWLDEGVHVLAAETSGEYTLYPTESSDVVKAYKYVPDDFAERRECFYVEYRSKNYPFGEGLSDSGLILYRVKESNAYIDYTGEKGNVDYGNMYGDPEVYVFRDWELAGLFPKKYVERKEVSSRGVCYAYLNVLPVSSYGGENATRNIVSYSDGTNSNLSLRVLRENADGSITFTLGLPVATREEDEAKKAVLSADSGIYSDEENRDCLFFDYGVRTGTAYVLVTGEKIDGADGARLAAGEYGTATELPVSFRKTILPSGKGVRYVYLCASHGGTYTEVATYRIGNEEGSGGAEGCGSLYSVALVGVGLFAVLLFVSVWIPKSKRRK